MRRAVVVMLRPSMRARRLRRASASIESGSRPTSVSTSTVCSPRPGGARSSFTSRSPKAQNAPGCSHVAVVDVVDSARSSRPRRCRRTRRTTRTGRAAPARTARPRRASAASASSLERVASASAASSASSTPATVRSAASSSSVVAAIAIQPSATWQDAVAGRDAGLLVVEHGHGDGLPVRRRGRSRCP